MHKYFYKFLIITLIILGCDESVFPSIVVPDLPQPIIKTGVKVELFFFSLKRIFFAMQKVFYMFSIVHWVHCHQPYIEFEYL